MSSIYADITGKGSADAAQMAIDDFRRQGFGQADRARSTPITRNKPISRHKAREWLENEKVDAILEVAASATRLPPEVAKSKNKIIVFNGPGATRLTKRGLQPALRSLGL